MNTFFAAVIGFDTIDVSAVAVAEIRVDEQSTILPLSIPHNHASDECLGTPPKGQLPNDLANPRDSNVCKGADSGNFGILDSPFFEDHRIVSAKINPDGDFTACLETSSLTQRAALALATGLDHSIQPWPSGDPGNSFVWGSINDPNQPGRDDCAADIEPPEIPYILLTQSGEAGLELHEGLVGPSRFDGSPSRLRQTGGIGTRLSFGISGDAGFNLDNVGLWEYLDNPLGQPSNLPDVCKRTYYEPLGSAGGRTATEAIIECVEGPRLPSARPGPEFSASIIESPRFALVPVLGYAAGSLTGGQNYGIVEFKPVYIQSSWYDCRKGSQQEFCFFLPSDFDFADPDNPMAADYSILFNPGEGTSAPLAMDRDGIPETLAVVPTLQGISAIVLEWEWLYDGAKNDLGGVAPLSVSLFE